MPQKQTFFSTNAIHFLLSCLMLGVLSIGIAAASNLEAKSGSWVDKQYAMQGEWSVEQRGDQQVISFNDGFNTKKGPDLKIFLSPQSINDATGNNATEGSVLVAPLQSNKGAQEYVLPAGININDFKSLLIHCEAYSVLWGGADL